MASEETPLTQGMEAQSSYSAAPKSSQKSLNVDPGKLAKMKRMASFARKRVENKYLEPDRAVHTYVYLMMRPKSTHAGAMLYRCGITTLILSNVIAFIAESDKAIAEKYSTFFEEFEGFSSCLFMLEYIARVIVVGESKKYAQYDAAHARMAYMVTFPAIVDLVSSSPWFIETGAYLICQKSLVLPNLTWLRVLRLFRLLKNSMVFEAFDVFARVLYFNAEILILSVILCAILVLLLSTLLFYLRPPGQSDEYRSILATMYLAIMMLTGQGAPDGPLPWYTKMMVCCCSVFAVGLFAIQASMLTWGFEQEAERRLKKHGEKKKRQLQRQQLQLEDLPEDSTSSGEEDLEQQWEEYEHMVASSDDDEEKSNEKPLTTYESARILKIYAKLDRLDSSQSGKIKTEELSKYLGHTKFENDLAVLDANGDGYTTCEEFLEWLEHKKRSDAEQFQKTLAELDSVDAYSNLAPSTQSPSIAQGNAAQAEVLQSITQQLQKLQDQNLQLIEDVAELKRQQ